MNLIEEVARHLEFAGVGFMATEEEDGDIFFGHMPDAPDEAVCVFSNDSASPGDEDGARIEVMTRGVVGDAKTPYERALRVTEALDGFVGFLAGDGPKLITVAFTPEDASNTRFRVSNSKPRGLQISDITEKGFSVTPLAECEAKITVTSVNNAMKAELTVTVSAAGA